MKKDLLIKITSNLKEWRDLLLILTSGMFDARWYLEKYPDIRKAKIFPAFHYLRYGGQEGRDPGPSFSSRWYLDQYADVRNSGVNPLIHYTRYGKGEGRLPTNVSVEKIEAPGLIRQRKIFCIGSNKTGTTSLEQAFRDFDFMVGNQTEAESFIYDWAKRDFSRIIQYCKTAEAFQDVPFSLDFTYQTLDAAFPGSKFILTVRNSPEEWYRSIVRFHSKLLGTQKTPTADDLKKATYHAPGWLWDVTRYVYGVDETAVYDETIYKARYMQHNQRVMEYFRYRPGNLLILNLAEPTAMQSLCAFLDVPYQGQQMPHLNQSSI